MEIAMDRVAVRWMIRQDMAEVLDIERASFEFQWTEEDFVTCLRQRNCIGVAAEFQGRIVGFMVYMLLKSQLHLVNFAVSPSFRRRGVGRQMIEKLVNKLSQQRRQSIRLEVRETNLGAQLFFQKNGFVASGVLRGHYEDTGEDAYSMTCHLKPAEDSNSLPPVHANRITPYLEVPGEN